MLYDKLVTIKQGKESKWTGAIFSTSLSSVYKNELITNWNWDIMSTIHENNLNSPSSVYKKELITNWNRVIISTIHENNLNSTSSVYKKELITNWNWDIISTIHEKIWIALVASVRRN